MRSWEDLSDDELRDRLDRRMTAREHAQDLQRILVLERDEPDFADVIDEILDRPAN